MALMFDAANFRKNINFQLESRETDFFDWHEWNLTIKERLFTGFVIDETREIIHNAVDEKSNAVFPFGNEPSLVKYRYDRTAPRTQLNARDIYKLNAIPFVVCGKEARHLYILIGSLEI